MGNKIQIRFPKWLYELFDIRHKWRPPYMMSYFSLGMSTTQRSEAMNHLVKMRVKPSFTFYEFIGSLEIVLLGLHNKEIIRDQWDIFSPSHLITNLPIESFLLDKDTFEVFSLYQNQVSLNINYFLCLINNDPVNLPLHNHFFLLFGVSFLPNHPLF